MARVARVYRAKPRGTVHVGLLRFVSWRKPKYRRVLLRNGFREYGYVRVDAIGASPHAVGRISVRAATSSSIDRAYVERKAFDMSEDSKTLPQRLAHALDLFRGHSNRAAGDDAGLPMATITVDVPEAGGTNVIPFPCKRSDGDRMTTGAGAEKKYQLQLRVDAATHDFIGYLLERSEAESVSELFRLALREYERALYEYDEFRLPDLGTGTDRSDRSRKNRKGLRSTIGTSQGKHPASPKDKGKRLSFFLKEAPIKRLERLTEITNASTRTDVIKIALCVLDAKLDEYASVLSKGGATASLVVRSEQSEPASSQDRRTG